MCQPLGGEALGVESSSAIYQSTSPEACGLVEGAPGAGEVFCESSDENAEEVVPKEVP